MTGFTAACVQINASNDLAENIASLGGMIREARAAGADFITTPECAAMIEKHHVYLTKDGRVSMAGVTQNNAKYIAEAMCDVTGGV